MRGFLSLGFWLMVAVVLAGLGGIDLLMKEDYGYQSAVFSVSESLSFERAWLEQAVDEAVRSALDASAESGLFDPLLVRERVMNSVMAVLDSFPCAFGDGVSFSREAFSERSLVWVKAGTDSYRMRYSFFCTAPDRFLSCELDGEDFSLSFRLPCDYSVEREGSFRAGV
ncbi:MAG: hypothetical protein HY917_01105 [Candidatus Diapherotrites archaeon]|nr:hypothetical protein [Candidatus Diapherotrites archaeon]